MVIEERIKERIRQSNAVLRWVQGSLDGLNIQNLPYRKRSQLSAACWHTTVEHAQAIFVLADWGLLGSAQTLLRPLFESLVRGVWLDRMATDDEVGRAVGRDKFPDFSRLVAAVEGSEESASERSWSALKDHSWSHLCSLSHTGYQQIVPRLGPGGVGSNYGESEVRLVLEWADNFALEAVIRLALLAKDEALAKAALDRMIRQ